MHYFVHIHFVIYKVISVDMYVCVSIKHSCLFMMKKTSLPDSEFLASEGAKWDANQTGSHGDGTKYKCNTGMKRLVTNSFLYAINYDDLNFSI